MTRRPLGWLAIVRLGLVQTALGAIVVLTTSTLNRVMVVELLLPAMLPGALVALHYAVQLARPCFGHGSDTTGRRTPWILGGMAVLAAGGTLATVYDGVRAKLNTKEVKPAEGEIPADMSTMSLVGGGLIAGDSLAALSVGIYGLLTTVM